MTVRMEVVLYILHGGRLKAILPKSESDRERFVREIRRVFEFYIGRFAWDLEDRSDVNRTHIQNIILNQIEGLDGVCCPLNLNGMTMSEWLEEQKKEHGELVFLRKPARHARV